MQDRRNTYGLADLCQAGTTVDRRRSGREQSVHAGGNTSTAGNENEDIVLDQFLDDGDMFFVVLGPGVVAADDTGDTADPAINDVIVEGIVTAAEGPAQMVLDRLDAESGDLGGLMLRNHDLRTSVLEVFDGHLDDAKGILHGIMFIELDMDDIFLLHLGDGMGSNELGMETFGDIGQILKDTLDIDYHRITGTSDNREFLLQESTRWRNTVTLQ